MANKNVCILLAEDNEDHAFLFKKMLRQRIDSVDYTVYAVGNGQEALEFVKRTGRHVNAAPPDVVFLDINMPVKNGFEVLETLKSDELTKQIPVIMLTSSDNDADIKKCYGLGSNSFVVKPIRHEEYLERILNTVSYWVKVNIPPPKE